MKRIKVFRQLIAVILALMLVCLSAAAEETAESTLSLEQYTDCKTINAVFRAAEKALANGADPAAVYDEMFTVAESHNMTPFFQYALENAAAYGSDRAEKLTAVVGTKERKADLQITCSDYIDSRTEFRAFESYAGSAAFREMIADPEAQYCLDAGFWTEAEFREMYGTDYTRFTPARPRPGYACVVIQDGSQSAPETAWDATGDASYSFLYTMDETFSHVGDRLQDFWDSWEEWYQLPVFTGNPDLASSIWVYRLSYPFYAWYGENNRREVRGFNCEISLTVIDATTHKTIAKCSAVNRLGRTIDTWHDWIAEADIPWLQDANNYSSFISALRKTLEKQFASADTSRRITPICAKSVLNGILREESEKTSDPWAGAICESGVRDIVLNADSVTFRLRSFDPRVRELGAYAKAADGDAWLETALENASAYDLEQTLPLAGSRMTAKGKTELTTAVKKAASTAQQGFGGKDMASALSDRLFPSPAEEKNPEAASLLSPTKAFTDWYESHDLAETGLSAASLAIICFARRSQTVSVKGGPHQIEITCTGAEPATLMAGCASAILDEMAYIPASSRMSADQVEAALTEALTEAAVTAHSKSGDKYVFRIDLDELAEGKNPSGYLAVLAGFNLAETVESLRAYAESLPEEAAQPMPKAGGLTGPKTGTKVTFDLYPGAGPTYVQIRSEKDNSLLASAFVLPGQKVTIQAPNGFCRLLCATGPCWYGEEKLFGDTGSYYASESTQILSSEYTHTYSLNPGDEDDILFFEASPEDFR